MASRALSIALSGKIEEGQVMKAVINLKKIGEPEEVIKFVSDIFIKYPTLSTNSTLLEKRATSKMDMAKKCINTGKDHRSNSKTQARAWEMCRQLLEEAEKDLYSALHNADSYNKEFIEKHFDFLEIMKNQSKKPKK